MSHPRPLAPLLVLLLLAAACADDGGPAGSSANNGGMGTNNGTTATNNGTPGSNNGTTATNNGTPGSNNSTTGTNNGTIGSNNGTTGTNNGTAGSNNSTTGTNNGTTGIIEAEVEPLYPSAGASWNDWVLADGSSPLTASDASCSGADVACVHGGELRKVALPELASCAGLTARDSLGAFTWTCAQVDGAPAMVSTELAAGHVLSELLEDSGVAFRLNQVTVERAGVEVAHTAPAIWWLNPVMRDDDGGALSTAGAVVVAGGTGTVAFTFAADGVALVLRPGVVVDGPLWAQSRGRLWIEKRGAQGVPFGVALQSVHHSVLRGIEGVQGVTGDGLSLVRSSRNRLSDLELTGATGTTLSLDRSHHNVVERAHVGAGGVWALREVQSTDNRYVDVDVRINGLSQMQLVESQRASFVGLTLDNVALDPRTGLSLVQTTDVAFAEVRVRNLLLDIGATAMGTRLDGVEMVGGGIRVLGSHSRLSQVRIANTTGVAVQIGAANASAPARDNSVVGLVVSNAFVGVAFDHNAHDNVVAQVLVHNVSSGVVFGGVAPTTTAFNNVVVGLTVANAANQPVLLGPGGGHLLRQVAVVNSGQGLTVGGAGALAGARLADVASSYTVLGAGITVTPAASGVTFEGLVRLGANFDGGNCSVAGGDCAAPVFSGATVQENRGMRNTFIGDVTTDDAVNASDEAGRATWDFIATGDWLAFEHPWRGWGANGNGMVFPDASQASLCLLGGRCRIFDFALRSADDVARAAFAAPAATDLDVQVWRVEPAPTSAADCEAAVEGSALVQGMCRSTFLVHTIELAADGVGNDNGLCEAGESCLAAPNLGAYQGHGAVETSTIGAFTVRRHVVNGR